MWIELTNTHDDGTPVTTRLNTPETDGDVEFSDTAKAQVSKQVGRALVRDYDSIVETGSAGSETDSDSATDDGAAADGDADAADAAGDAAE